MKAVKEKLDADNVEAFEKGASAYAKKVVATFKDWEFVSYASTAYSVALISVFETPFVVCR